MERIGDPRISPTRHNLRGGEALHLQPSHRVVAEYFARYRAGQRQPSNLTIAKLQNLAARKEVPLLLVRGQERSGRPFLIARARLIVSRIDPTRSAYFIMNWRTSSRSWRARMRT